MFCTTLQTYAAQQHWLHARYALQLSMPLAAPCTLLLLQPGAAAAAAAAASCCCCPYAQLHQIWKPNAGSAHLSRVLSIQFLRPASSAAQEKGRLRETATAGANSTISTSSSDDCCAVHPSALLLQFEKLCIAGAGNHKQANADRGNTSKGRERWLKLAG
jgi:hypothetical protein